jgi:farnesyl diphosphate synthase
MPITFDAAQHMCVHTVIPAKAGIQYLGRRTHNAENPAWIPAFAGMTRVGMDVFNEKLAENVAEIERGLDVLLSADRLSGPGEPPERLLAAMRHGALNGGKRLRPFLLRQTAVMLGVAPELTLPAAIAVELVHCYSLIHDDLPAMDDDDLRRGQPTVHKAYDDATAILAGDALLTLAFGYLAEHGALDPAIAARLVIELAAGAGTGGMVGGQMRDIEGESMPLDSLGIARMQAMKTGALIRASIRMGAILGGADRDALGHLTAYAEAAGRAFQLADDLLDVTASPGAMGKATGKDAALNKQTLVSKLGADAARRHLGDMVHEAITALTSFGPEADPLRAAARYFASRDN